MRQIILSVLLFLLLLNTSSADIVYEDYFASAGHIEEIINITNDYPSADSYEVDQMFVGDGANMEPLTFVTCYMNNNHWKGSSAGSGEGDVVFKYNSVEVGTGSMGFWRMNTDGIPGYDWVYIDVWIDDGLTGVPAGIKKIDIEGDIVSSVQFGYADYDNDLVYKSTSTSVFLGNDILVPADEGWVIYGEHSSYVQYEFFNYYNYTHNTDYNRLEFNLLRDSDNESFGVISNGYLEILNETTKQSTDLLVVYSTDIENSTWTLDWEDEYGQTYYHTLDFFPMGPHSADINFNQTYYTDPEIVGVQYDIVDMYTASNEYWIKVLGDNGGMSIDVNVEYIELTNGSGQVNYTMEKHGLTLPMNIRAMLYAYSKDTGKTGKIAYSEEVVYNPATVSPGSVWTDKDSYNTTEIVTIYTDTENGGDIELWLRNDFENLHEWYRIGSGLTSIKHLLQKSHVGTWDVYLFEEDANGNDAITNQTVFTVLADEDTAYFNWWYSPIYKGEPASYDYIATSNNSIVRIYDGTGNKLYEFNAIEGYNTGQITTTTGTVGNWTGSLYDNGTYYNASLEVEGSYSWVRFQDDSYYVGDTIIIEYFIVNPDHKIRLRDGLCSHGGRMTVLTWMPGTFMTGQRGTLKYSLTEDNEFGHDVETRFNSGYLTPGDWKVEASGATSWNEIENAEDTTYVHGTDKGDQMGGTGGDGSIISELTAIAELAGFRGEVGLFILSILIIIITSAAMLISKFPVPGVLCIDILQFFAFIGIGFIPILYLILFGVVAGLIVFGTIFFRKAG